MRIVKNTFLLAAVLCACSCSSWMETDKAPIKYAAVVTMKPQEDDTFFMKQNDTVAYVALNKELQKFPFKEKLEKRAIVYFTVPDEGHDVVVEGFKYGVGINVQQIDTMYIRSLTLYEADKADSYGDAAMDLYGNSPGYVMNTEIQDGYLSLACRYMVGNASVKHQISVVYGANPEDPYELWVKHNAKGDYAVGMDSFLYTFSLKDLPYTGGEAKDVTVKWNSFATGKEESLKLKYETRPDWIPTL